MNEIAHTPQARRAETVEGAQPDVQETAPGGEAGISVLSADVVMEGNLVTSGELLLDGTIHGAVQASRVIIDTNGILNGQAVASEVLVRGRVIGPICGVRVHLAPGAHVEGDVLSQSIVVEDGAFIDGQIRHSEDPLGDWQRMWYGEEGAEGAETAGEGDAGEEGATEEAFTTVYLHPVRQEREAAASPLEEMAGEKAEEATKSLEIPLAETKVETKEDEREKK